jgi:energy-coupling factor transporter ATP-binding protein EcfA2
MESSSYICTQPDLVKENFIFIGPRGSGKSSLVNALAKEIITKSGSSTNFGLTTSHVAIVSGNYRFIDTPAIPDEERTQNAVNEIFLALSRYKGTKKIFFTMRYCKEDVNGHDFETVKTIMNWIGGGDNYNLIFTMAYKHEEAGKEFENTLSKYISMKHYRFSAEDSNIRGESNQLMRISDKIVNFILKESQPINVASKLEEISKTSVTTSIMQISPFFIKIPSSILPNNKNTPRDHEDSHQGCLIL